MLYTLGIVGLLCIVLGFFIIKKQLVFMASRSANVKPENAKAFSKMVGIATIGFGIAFLCMGIFSSIGLRTVGTILSAVLGLVSIGVYFNAQGKYN